MDTIRPFSNGTQFMDWTAANCDRCAKAADRDNPPRRCPCDIEQALLEACMGDGMIPLPIADRMGRDQGRYNWKCGEWEAAK